jgi:hypothetical protein
MSRVHLTFALLILALVLTACSSESRAPAQESKPTPASVAPPATQINPAALNNDAPCTIVPNEVLTALLGNSINDMYVLPTDGAEIGCNYEFAGGKSLKLRVELARSGQQAFSDIMQYQEVSQGSEDVSLGDVARIQETQQDIRLYAVLNGWYVTVEAYGGFTREQVLALGQWLSARFVPYPQTASPTAAPPTGAMSDMRVTIEHPAQFASVTTLQDLEGTGFLYEAICSDPGKILFRVSFASMPGKLPTPVSLFVISAGQNAPVGTPLPVDITIGTGDASDADKTFTWKGRATYTGDGLSGVFESDDGQVKGSWSCAFQR